MIIAVANPVLPPYNQQMTNTISDPVDYAISALADRETIKVWSVIVTIFGDLAQNSGDEISGLHLSAITERIGIKPEAMRVAIHRLRKDNWIESRKVGRVSQYRLSTFGYEESKAASPRIYGKPKIGQSIQQVDWHLLLLEPGTTNQIICPNQIEISQGIILVHGPVNNVPPEALSVKFDTTVAPNWVRESIFPDALFLAYKDFFGVLNQIKAMLKNPHQLEKIDVIVLRVLIVHSWRRLLLRHLEIADDFFTEDWIGSKCRALVVSILDDLPNGDF